MAVFLTFAILRTPFQWTPHTEELKPTVEQQSNLCHNGGQVYISLSLVTEYPVWNDSWSFCTQLQTNFTV
jgi:hypothetical protein